MTSIPRVSFATVVCCAAMFHCALTASAQTGSARSTLSGRVVDHDGGVVPGAIVVVRRNATGAAVAHLTTNREGLFVVAGLDPGSYSVTCSLQGFKTVVVSDLQIVTGTPSDVEIHLEVGAVAETITVMGSSALVQHQSTTVSSVIPADEITKLPLTMKNALEFVTSLPGVEQAGNHVMRGSTTIAGLPQSAIAISIDGIYTQRPDLKSTEFFSLIIPNVDAVEDVSVSMATPGAEASAQGAVQVRFTTRSGSNQLGGRLYETWRHPIMNANTFFNKVSGLPVLRISLNQFGGNLGGPLVLPGFDGHGRAFFFTNVEYLRQPQENNRPRIILSPAAMAGLFSYTTTSGTREMNLLSLAAANGQIASIDPTIGGLMNQIVAATSTTGTTSLNTDPNTSKYVWNSPSELQRGFATGRIDVNLSSAHRLSGIYTFNSFDRNPNSQGNADPRFPGFPSRAAQLSYRHAATAILRSTSSSTVNELSIGIYRHINPLDDDVSPDQFVNQGGYSLTLSGGSTGGAFAQLAAVTSGSNALANANGPGNHQSQERFSTLNIADKISWQRGRHELQIGEETVVARSWTGERQVVPLLGFGLDAGDPASGMFSPANFPGASNANLADARFLYGLLTGRITQVTTEAGLDLATGQYIPNGFAVKQAHLAETGAFVQDALRVRPHLTVNAGVRYEVQFPFRSDNSLWSDNTIADACGVSGVGDGPGGRPCNLFKPGTLTGSAPTYKRYDAGIGAYAADYRNVAPSIGAAWLPAIQQGPWRAVLGDPDQATVRVAYARAFTRDGLSQFLNVFNANPGATRMLVRNAANGNLVLPGESWPVLFSQTGRLGPGDFARTPTYPLPADRSLSVNLFDPHWRMGAIDSFSAGLQRAISRDTALEIRYVGTRGRRLNATENWNEVNLVENGFLDEFKRAQANLYANIAAGRGQTFAYFGTDSGTSPLPIYLAYFTGSATPSNISAYTGASWTNATFVGRFASLNPNPAASAATDLLGSAAFRANALAAGLPTNLFVVNPDVSAVNVLVSRGFTRYDSLQIELRRRLSRGLAMNVNYTYGRRRESRLDSLRTSYSLTPSIDGVPHALKLTAVYDLPIGGWSMSVAGRVTSGAPLNFGNVRLVGMTLQELQRAIRYRIVAADPAAGTPVRVYELPQDIIDNTVKAFSIGVTGYTAGAPAGRYFAPANGPDCVQVVRGDCAPKDVFVISPLFSRFDLSARKMIPTGRKTTLSLEADVLNVFNTINFNPLVPLNPGNAGGYPLSTSYADLNDSADSGARTGQLVFRFNW